jgi:multidrug transporter EmrE-like cation transporter
MFRSSLIALVQPLSGRLTLVTFLLIVCNMAFNIIANSSFKYSATSSNWNAFLAWQVLGNIAGFVTVLTLTGLLRTIPLNVAFPLTAGLSIIGVQVIGAKLLFNETLSPAKWLGTLLIILGITLISGQ